MEIPKDERVLLFLAGHALNEIGVFSKLAVYATKSAKLSQGGEPKAEVGQAVIIIRTWAGKVHEAWQMFRRFFQSVPAISSTYLARLGDEATAAKDELNKYFGRPQSLTDLRDYAFHMPNADELSDAFDALPENDMWTIHAGGIDGNMFAGTTEVLVSMAFNRKLRAGKGAGNLTELLAQAHQISRCMMTLLSAVTGAIIRSRFPDLDWEKAFVVQNPPRLESVALPFFLDESTAKSKTTP